MTTQYFTHPDGGELDAAALERARNEGFDDVHGIQHAVQEHAGLTVYPLLALRLARDLVGRSKVAPDHPQRYVLVSIRQSPEEVRKWLFENQ